MSNLIARARALSPRTSDRLFAGALVVAQTVEVFIWADGDLAAIPLSMIAVAGIATLAWRRERPLIPGLAQPVTMIVSTFFAGHVAQNSTTTFLALLVTLYSLGRYAPSPRGAQVAALMTASVGLTTLLLDEFDYALQLVWIVVLGTGPFLIGRVMGSRTRMRDELLQRNEELERDREAHASRAVEDERVRIASELQAVVANGVSAMVLQAEAVPRVIEAGDNASAEHALTVIEETGRDALAEMRRLLGVLRRDGEQPSLAPIPTLAEARRLVAQRGENGLAIELGYEGEEFELSPGADLAAYRVLQEALDGAASGGASKASVKIGYLRDELSIDVSDDRSNASVDQATLHAMRERLDLYGGRVRADVTDSGHGFRVVARLPLSGAAV